MQIKYVEYESRENLRKSQNLKWYRDKSKDEYYE